MVGSLPPGMSGNTLKPRLAHHSAQSSLECGVAALLSFIIIPAVGVTKTVLTICQRFTAIITEPGWGRPLRAFRRQGRAKEGVLRVLGFVYDVAAHLAPFSVKAMYPCFSSSTSASVMIRSLNPNGRLVFLLSAR